MRTAVVGVGNTLMRDDGVGVHVARRLMDLDLPDDAVAVDAGTSPDAAYLVSPADRLIVIDAARLGGTPGTIYSLTLEEAEAAGEGVRSCHDMGLVQSIRVANPSEPCPSIEILGVEPKEISWGVGLSSEIEGSIARVIEIVLQKLKGLPCS